MYNLNAGLMATTTMVGSAVAYTKTQAGGEYQKEKNERNQNSGHWPLTTGQAKTQQYIESWGWITVQGYITSYDDVEILNM